MRHKKVLIIAVLVGIVGVGIVSRDVPFSQTVSAEDRALEKIFRDAAAAATTRKKGEGCQTIPYPDLVDECIEGGESKDRECKEGILRNCDTLGQKLTNAIAHKEKKKIADLRNECAANVAQAEACLAARAAVQVVFKRAEGKVLRDRRDFESMRDDKSTKPGDKAYYKRMVEYCDLILEYMKDKKAGHEKPFTDIHILIKNCNDEIVRGDEALERLK